MINRRINRNMFKRSSKFNFRKKLGLLTLSFLLCFLLNFTLYNGYKSVLAAPLDPLVYDYSDLFTDDEESSLQEELSELSAEGKVDIIIITTNSLEGQTADEYLEDFYDSVGPGYESSFGTATLMLLNMDPNDRGIQIQGYKDAEYSINNTRIESIIDAIYSDLVEGNYYNAVVGYGREVVTYMNLKPDSNTSSNTTNPPNTTYTPHTTSPSSQRYRNQDPTAELFTNPFVQLIVAVVIGGITVGIMAGNAGGRRTTNSKTYLDSSKAFIPIQEERYIKTTTTRVKKPSNDNHNNGGGNFGGSSSGTSSGGHSHSSGGRGF